MSFASSFPSREEILERKSLWRSHLREPAAGTGHRLAIAATFTAEPLEPFAGAALLERGFAPSIEILPYNQVFQFCHDPSAYFETAKPDTICILWRLEDICARDLQEIAREPAQAAERVAETLDQLDGAIRSLRANFEGSILVAQPPFPQAPGINLADITAPATTAGPLRHFLHYWTEKLNAIEGVHVVDLDALQRLAGVSAAHDTRKWYLYRQPYSEPFLGMVGDYIGRIIFSLVHASRKCVAVDCDNTLWGGVIGEDGLAGIELGDEFPGSAFRDLQRMLLHWKNMGIYVAILSKNNEPEVWEVFDNHDGMILKKEDIAAYRINWERKSGNLIEVARELNIGTDAFVLLDDSPAEISEVQSTLPEVACVLLPEDPAEFLPVLSALPYFERVTVTAEDAQRTAMALQERSRNEIREMLSMEEFVATLDLEVELFPAGEEHVGRVAQLINKTNQFNMTTLRRSDDEVRALLASKDYEVFAGRVRDRFGEYGLTIVLIFEKGDAQWYIDTFLMSCRVLGRSVESAVLAKVVEFARANGADTILGRVIPTPKNVPAREVYQKHGFEPGDDSESWVLDTRAEVAVPGGVRVNALT